MEGCGRVEQGCEGKCQENRVSHLRSVVIIVCDVERCGSCLARLYSVKGYVWTAQKTTARKN